MTAREGLCVLTPVRDGQEASLRRTLRALPRGASSPMVRVPGTHFARWAVVALEGRDGKPVPREPSRLLFASEFDEPLERYALGLCERLGGDAHAIWGHCDGYPGGDPPALAAYLLAHRVRPGYSVVAYPDASVEDVRAAFAVRERLNDFLVRTTGLDSPALQRAWTRRFGDGEV